MGKDVYLALAAVGWADGNLDGDEADAIVKAALGDGHELEALAEIEEATKAAHPLGPIDVSKLSEGDRKFVFAVATWMCALDGELHEGEKKILDELAGRFELDDETRADIGIIVREVAYDSEGDSPFQYDLDALRGRFT